MLQKAWDYYSESYNLLAQKLSDSNIDVSLLDNVITAYDGVIRDRSHTNYFPNMNNKNVSKKLEQKLNVAKKETNSKYIGVDNSGV